MAARVSITIVEASELPKSLGTLLWKIHNTSNAETKEKSLKIKKPPNGQNYFWNQSFVFTIPKDDIKQAKLQFVLHEKNKMKSGSDFIGQVEIPILDIIDKKKGDEWFDLEKRKDKDKVSGKVHLKYSYEFVEEVANVKSKKEEKIIKVEKKT